MARLGASWQEWECLPEVSDPDSELPSLLLRVHKQGLSHMAILTCRGWRGLRSLWTALCLVTTVTTGKGDWGLGGKTHEHSLAFVCGFTTLVCAFQHSLSVNETDTKEKWQAQASLCKDRAVYHHPMEGFQENTD